MLDLARLMPCIEEMVTWQKGQSSLRGNQISLASVTMGKAGKDWKSAAERIHASNTSWLPAGLLERPDERHTAAPAPEEYLACATDGSQIAPDRNEIAWCLLLNVGTVYLRYGQRAQAQIKSNASLIYRETDVQEGGADYGDVLPSKELARRRLMAECEELEKLMEQQAKEGLPAIALSDGNLVLWMLESEKSDSTNEAIKPFINMLKHSRDLNIPVAGYISKPGSREVVTALRMLRCDKKSVNCDLYCGKVTNSIRREAPCAGTEEIQDIDLFQDLHPGERSALFASNSKIIEQAYPEGLRIHFFYLNTGEEIARVEIPEWAGNDPKMLDRVHAMILDQAVKGQGYPRALTEAHECAIVRGADREAFYLHLQRLYVKNGLPLVTPRKALSKRTRGV